MSDRPSPQPVRVIQELFQDYNDIGYKQALSELDNALEEACPHIVIEPMRLGDETQRWVTVGNVLHKSTVLAAIGTTVALGMWPKQPLIWAPLASVTGMSYTTYTLCWQADPCCKYQIERDQSTLASLDIGNVSTHSVVVLTYKDDTRRRLLHTSAAGVAAVALAYTLYAHYYCTD